MQPIRAACAISCLRRPRPADSYRRDRRKDVLFQENGYHVLRFLCEDVGQRLDEVLDAIVRALSHRRKKLEFRSP
jgi:very-short-patch-repair endonuclease